MNIFINDDNFMDFYYYTTLILYTWVGLKISGDEYIQCFARVVPGQRAKQMPATAAGYGREDKMVTQEHDYDALQSHPRWTDDIKVTSVINIYFWVNFL